MNYLLMNNRLPYLQTQTQLQMPTGKLNLPPGMQAQVNFYDPLTGNPVGPSVSTLPKINQTYAYRSPDLNINVSGDPRDILKLRELLFNNKIVKKKRKKIYKY